MIVAVVLAQAPGAATSTSTPTSTATPTPTPTSTPTATATPLPDPDPPPDVLALLPAARTPVAWQQADLDLDGAPEWIILSRFDHPARLDYGPRSAEWRAGQRIQSRTNHELAIVGREKGALRLRFSVELSGNERQAVLVERLLGADKRRGRLPVVLAGARACQGSCGPVEAHLVIWDPRRRTFADYTYAGVELVMLGSDGAAELWFADRRPGDPICCPSGYTVTRVGLYGTEVDTLSTRQVPSDRMRKVLLPGGLILRQDPPAATVTPAAGR